MPGADEGDVAGGVPGREPAGLRAAAGHPADLPGRRRHPRPRLPAPPAAPAPRHRRDHREYPTLSPRLAHSLYMRACMHACMNLRLAAAAAARLFSPFQSMFPPARSARLRRPGYSIHHPCSPVPFFLAAGRCCCRRRPRPSPRPRGGRTGSVGQWWWTSPPPSLE